VSDTPPLDDKRLPEHGAEWGDGVVLRTKSMGPGVPSQVVNPRGAKPTRVISGDSDFLAEGGKLYIVSNKEEGEDAAIVVGY